MTVPAFRTASSEDIYKGLDDTKESVPSSRRVTVRLGRVKAVLRDKDDAKREPPTPPTSPAQEEAVPSHSMRRMRVARVQTFRVSGTPDNIQEPITEAILRDPRRE